MVSSAGTVHYEVSANSYNSASELGEYKVKIYLDGDLITFEDMPTNENMIYGEDAKGQYVEYTWYLVSA